MQGRKFRMVHFLLVAILLAGCNLFTTQYREHRVQPETAVTGSLGLMTTDNASLAASDLLTTAYRNQFAKYRVSVLNEGIADSYYWLRFSVINRQATDSTVLVSIENARLNQLALFATEGNRAVPLGLTGDFYPFSQRRILHKNFVYQVSVPPGSTRTFLLSVNQVGHACIIPLKVFTERNFRSDTFRDYLFDGVTYGVLIFVALLSILFFLSSRHLLYLYYGLYIATAILWFMSYFGLGYQYLWPDSPALNTAVAPGMAALNIMLNVQICQILLKLTAGRGYLQRMMNVTKLALGTIGILPFFLDLNHFGYTINHAYLLAFLFLILVAMVLVSYAVILHAVKGLIVARLYLIASLLKAGSIINLALLELGLTPALNNMEGLLQVGIFIEITLLTLALAMRYTNYKVRTFEKVIEAHENERALISREIHDGISNTLTGINYGILNFTADLPHLPAHKTDELTTLFGELSKVQAEARSISHNTMPDYIRNHSIVEIVAKLVGELQDKSTRNLGTGRELKINFSFNESSISFSETVKLNIFRIIQELLTNILRHAEASQADLVFSFNKKELQIIIEDNGVGISVSSPKSKGKGLENIRFRVDLLDGQFALRSPVYKRPAIDSSADFGTMVRIRIPYRDNIFKFKQSHEY